MGILSSRWQFRHAALQPESFQWGVRETCSQPHFVPTQFRSDRLTAAALSTHCRQSATHPTRRLSDTISSASLGSQAGISDLLSSAWPYTCFSISGAPQHCSVCGLPASESCPCCDESFCRSHVYSCSDCQTVFCGACLDTHFADGHWSDSDTARAMADSVRGTFDRGCCELNFPGSTAPNSTLDQRLSTIQAVALLLSACLFSICGTLPLETSL